MGAALLGIGGLVWQFTGLRTAVPNLVNPSAISQATLIAESEAAFAHTAGLIAEAEKQKLYNVTVPPQFVGKTIKDVKLKPDQKYIALTFDDGPWPEVTNNILYTLKAHGVRATFFVVGLHVQTYPEQLRQVVAEGHVLANHTWNHRYHKFSSAEAAVQLKKTADIIYKETGVKTALFRPPGGKLHNGLVKYANAHKYSSIMWSQDSGDTSRISSSRILANILAGAKPGAIILMHDGGGDRLKTASMLPQAIKELKKRGYQFVTVPELFELSAQNNAPN
ncbi:Peptidoglycan-N-acetylglucosamine deacetylase [Acaryochloris thomasi RCC1774]|uniref:Peptidoglycan-N-acetylglucosamine deacetylase n=1 Tax=Acaryochloris thomasi RCC1774 TaxID=1764569 RepID=A0A2W1JEP3_9CYAN|nr:Peptidoglycan-N-acetylglucosamine deacetylase [Acaryochloris thomasi RCC1774]